MPGDVVTIFGVDDIPVPLENRTQFVRLGGEVKAPGIYQVSPGETLPQLVQRAGGLSRDAYLYGTVFSRESTRVTVIICVVMVTFSETLLTLLYAQSFLPAQALLPWQVAGDLARVIAVCLSTGLMARGDAMVSDTDHIDDIGSAYQAIQDKLTGLGTEIDAVGRITGLLEKASEACVRIYRDAQRRHEAACQDPLLQPDDGVAEAFDAFIAAMHSLHDTVEVLREWIGQQGEPEPNAVVQDTFAAGQSWSE